MSTSAKSFWLSPGSARDDLDAADWPKASRQAREAAVATATEYLLGTPLLADYLEEGASALGVSLEDLEEE
jgi:hypothetical protein